jgi:hypothetical protein
MNTDKVVGEVAEAHAAFSAGQDGPFVEEHLNALGSAASVSAFAKSWGPAAASCPKVTLLMPGAGKSTMLVRAVKAPAVGIDATAFRVTASGGPLEGLEVTQVSTAVEGAPDVALTVFFIGATAEDIEGATADAHDKAASVLAGAGATQS